MRPAHSMVHVRDLPRAIAFYKDLTGFRVVDTHAYDGVTLVYLRGPDHAFEIELICPQDWTFAERPEPGRSHIAFAVADVDAEHARLCALGHAPDPVTPHVVGGTLQTRYFYIEDPEGNQIECLAAHGRYRSEQES